VLVKKAWGALWLLSPVTRINVGIKAALKEPATTFITNVGRRNAIRKASRASSVPTHAATVGSLVTEVS